MRLEILSYLLDIKETHSITQTADKYFISHQALSQAIRSLEKELQLTLLLRSKHGVSFTPAGERFLAFAKEVTAQKERLDADLACYRAEYAPLTAHTLSVYAIPRYFTPQFLDLIHILQTGRQKFNITLRNATNEEIFSKVNFDPFTIGLAVTYELQMEESLDDFLARRHLSYEIIESMPVYYCVHKNSPMAKSGIVDENKASLSALILLPMRLLPLMPASPTPWIISSCKRNFCGKKTASAAIPKKNTKPFSLKISSFYRKKSPCLNLSRSMRKNTIIYSKNF